MVMPSINFGSQFCSFDFHTMHFSFHTYAKPPTLSHSLFPSSPVQYVLPACTVCCMCGVALFSPQFYAKKLFPYFIG